MGDPQTEWIDLFVKLRLFQSAGGRVGRWKDVRKWVCSG